MSPNKRVIAFKCTKEGNAAYHSASNEYERCMQHVLLSTLALYCAIIGAVQYQQGLQTAPLECVEHLSCHLRGCFCQQLPA